MSDETQPLTLWQKFKANTKRFAENAVAYIPRGILFSGALFGVSYALGNIAPGFDFLGIGTLASGQVLGRLALHVGVGSLITGAIAISLPEKKPPETIACECAPTASPVQKTAANVSNILEQAKGMAGYIPAGGMECIPKLMSNLNITLPTKMAEPHQR